MKIPAPRLLPATIMAMAGLLGMKTVGLIRAVSPALAAASAPSPSPTPAASLPPGAAPRGAAPRGPAIGAPIGAPIGAHPPTVAAVSPAERTLLLDLRRRRQLLDHRAAALTTRESLLAAAERRLDQRIAQLKALEAKLGAEQAARTRRDDAAWTGLVALYQTMKPRQAAKIFDKLDMSVLLAVVDRMQTRRAAAILAAMQPDRAREVTDRLAALRTKRDGPAPPANGG